MASTKADNNRVAWTYTRNNGSTAYAVSAKAVYVLDGTDGAKYGGSAPAASVPHIPRGTRMRAVKCVSSGGKTVYVVAYDADAPIVTADATVTRDINGVDTVCTSTGNVREERFYDGIRETA